MLLRLDSPTGYMCHVLRTKSLNLPLQIEEFAKVLPIILLAWKAKKKDETDNDDIEVQLQYLQGSISSYPHTNQEQSKHYLPTNHDTPQSKRTKDIPLNTFNFIIPLGSLINMFYQLSPIPFILSNGDDDTDKENEHLEIVY
ncbi:8107_t:CDS:2 [Entrophospora sp. SA101]|nr:8107_t:CDS:2 [Entrophospora sp. SA101]CAJ0900490.1 9697_t:CDS:2 [Entrophospora sp. SA101]